MMPEEFDFFKTRSKEGLKTAVEQRDRPFNKFCEGR
jgi:hypothetical protein